MTRSVTDATNLRLMIKRRQRQPNGRLIRVRIWCLAPKRTGVRTRHTAR